MHRKYKMRIVTEQQLQDDIIKVNTTIDDLCAAAINLHNSGPQGYQSFMELRDGFRTFTTKVLSEYNAVNI